LFDDVILEMALSADGVFEIIGSFGRYQLFIPDDSLQYYGVVLAGLAPIGYDVYYC